MNALAKGQGWLANPTKLQRLKGMNKVRSIQQELDRYLKTWDEQPLTINMWSDFSVAQYQSIDSIDALEQKLAQFPPGTEFIISRLENAKDNFRSAQLRDFLVKHGMSIKEEQVVVPTF
jgi:hypothetical protein